VGVCVLRVCRCQMGYHNRKSKIDTRKGQKDRQRSTKHTHRAKDWVARTPLKSEGELRWYRRVSCSCSTIGTRRVNLVWFWFLFVIVDIIGVVVISCIFIYFQKCYVIFHLVSYKRLVIPLHCYYTLIILCVNYHILK
jgi:short subunit dehydrogenase-like uncharacterized protein